MLQMRDRWCPYPVFKARKRFGPAGLNDVKRTPPENKLRFTRALFAAKNEGHRLDTGVFL